MGITPGIGFFSRCLMNASDSLQSSMNSAGWAMLMSFGPEHGDRLEVLVSHHGAQAETAGAGPALLDGGEEDPVLAGQTDGGDRGVRLAQLLADDLGALEGAQTHEMLRVPQLDLVVVDPQVDRLGGLAAEDHLVVAGVLQLGAEEPAHHREAEQPGLRRDGGDDGAVAAGSGRPHQETGAEDEQVLRIEGLDLRGTRSQNSLALVPSPPR